MDAARRDVTSGRCGRRARSGHHQRGIGAPDSSQAARLRSMPGVHVFAGQSPQTIRGGLRLRRAAARRPRSRRASMSATIIAANADPAVSAVTTAIVAQASGSSVPQDGTGVNTPTLLYQTNYPMLVGANTLQQSGITGRGRHHRDARQRPVAGAESELRLAHTCDDRCDQRRLRSRHGRPVRPWNAHHLDRRRRRHQHRRRVSRASRRRRIS